MVPEMTLTLIVLLLPLGWLVNHRLKRQRLKEKRSENEIWSIGLYEGPDPVTLTPATGIINPILTADDITDTKARFVADPFMTVHDGRYHLFFELMNGKRNVGEIGHALSEDLKTWKYTGVVLKEKFHLSYPYVFEHDGITYMLPECAKSNAVRLYRAESFPDRWFQVTTIINNVNRKGPLGDPSIIFHNENWYLFTFAARTKNLHLYTSRNLTRGWHEHPKSPIRKNDPRFARPGGRIIEYKATLFRFAQDSIPSYGSRVWGFRITELTPENYREEPVSAHPVIEGGLDLWNNVGMHNIDAYETRNGNWIAFVDGLHNPTRGPQRQSTATSSDQKT